MTIYGPNARRDTFTINPGQTLTFVPRGHWHNVENIGNEEAKFVIVYNNERPEDLGISESVGSMSARVFKIEYLESPQDVIIETKSAVFSSSGRVKIPKYNPHTLNLAGITPQIQTSGGTGALGMATDFPILKGLALVSDTFEAEVES